MNRHNTTFSVTGFEVKIHNFGCLLFTCNLAEKTCSFLGSEFYKETISLVSSSAFFIKDVYIQEYYSYLFSVILFNGARGGAAG